MFNKKLVILRGGGDIASGIAYVLHNAGFNIIITEIDEPTSIRRKVSFSEAIYDKETVVEDIKCIRIDNIECCDDIFIKKCIAIIIDEKLKCLNKLHPDIIVDSIMAKKNIGTTIDMAPLVIGVGPGFIANKDCHYVIETMRGHTLGRIITSGSAKPNTGVPGVISNHSYDRVVYAKSNGIINNKKNISDTVFKGDIIATINDEPVFATIDGILRGIIRDGFNVYKGLKIADIDPRIDEKENCFTISDKARLIGGGVLLAIMQYLNNIK